MIRIQIINTDAVMAREIGLEAYEYQCSKGVNIGETTARRLGVKQRT